MSTLPNQAEPAQQDKDRPTIRISPQCGENGQNHVAKWQPIYNNGYLVGKWCPACKKIEK